MILTLSFEDVGLPCRYVAETAQGGIWARSQTHLPTYPEPPADVIDKAAWLYCQKAEWKWITQWSVFLEGESSLMKAIRAVWCMDTQKLNRHGQ